MNLNKNLFSKGTIKKLIKQDKFEEMQKELDAVNGTRVLIFNAKTVEELFSIFALIFVAVTMLISIAIINKGSMKGAVILVIGIVIVCYVQYRKPIDTYKESFMKDNELPSTLDTLIAGLDAGSPPMATFNYIKRNKRSNTSALIAECVASVNTGVGFNTALKNAAEKSFNHYFIRIAQIIKKSDISTVGLSVQLRELQKDIEEERINVKNERVDKLDNALFFPLLLGYFVPLVIMIVLPFIYQFTSMNL